jgi:hypothetical protein
MPLIFGEVFKIVTHHLSIPLQVVLATSLGPGAAFTPNAAFDGPPVAGTMLELRAMPSTRFPLAAAAPPPIGKEMDAVEERGGRKVLNVQHPATGVLAALAADRKSLPKGGCLLY